MSQRRKTANKKSSTNEARAAGIRKVQVTIDRAVVKLVEIKATRPMKPSQRKQVDKLIADLQEASRTLPDQVNAEAGLTKVFRIIKRAIGLGKKLF